MMVKKKSVEPEQGRYVRLWLPAYAHGLVLRMQNRTGWSLTKCVLIVLTEIEKRKEKMIREQNMALDQIISKYQ